MAVACFTPVRTFLSHVPAPIGNFTFGSPWIFVVERSSKERHVERAGAGTDKLTVLPGQTPSRVKYITVSGLHGSRSCMTGIKSRTTSHLRSMYESETSSCVRPGICPRGWWRRRVWRASRASAELVDPSVAYKSDSQSGLAGFEHGEGRSEHAFREEAGLLVP